MIAIRTWFACMEGVGRNPECMVLDLHLTVPRTQCPSARKLQHISPGKKKPPRAQPTAAHDRWADKQPTPSTNDARAREIRAG